MTQQTTRDGSQPEGQTITSGQTVNSRTTGSWLFSVDSRRDTGKDEGEKEDQPEPTAYTSLLTPLSDPQQPGAAFLLARRLWLSTCYTVGRGWGCLCICVPICPNLDLLLASCSDCRGLCVCVSVCVSVCVCLCVCVSVCVLSHIQLFSTPWTIARQAPLTMEFSRQEYWSGLCCHFLLQGIFLTLLSLSPALAGGFFTTSTALTAGRHTVENPDGTQEPRTPVQSHLPLSAGLLWTSFLTHVCGMCVLSHVRLFAAPWTVACQAPLSREFSRQQY